MTKNRARTPVYLDPGMHPGLEVKGLSGNLPDYILDNFTFKRDIAIRHTRSCDTNVLYVPKINRSSFKSALQVNGPMIWNNLSIHIRNCNSIHSALTAAELKYFVLINIVKCMMSICICFICIL